jgi:hypothetical protein
VSGILGVLAASNAAAAGGSTTTLDPATKGTNGTLSGGNLIWTGSGTNAIARSVASYSTGKFYFEVTVTTWDSTNYNLAIGLCNASQDMNVSIGASLNSLGMFATAADGRVFENNSAIIDYAPSAAFGASAVIGVAFDASAKLVWFRENGTWLDGGSGAGNPAAGTNGATYAETGAIFAAVYTNAASNVLTANFGATAYNAAAPSGFGNM